MVVAEVTHYKEMTNKSTITRPQMTKCEIFICCGYLLKLRLCFLCTQRIHGKIRIRFRLFIHLMAQNIRFSGFDIGYIRRIFEGLKIK